LRCLQGINFELQSATSKFVFSPQDGASNYEAAAAKLFPPVNLINYPAAVVVSKSEFSHLIEAALVADEFINIGICGRFVLFYTEQEGRSQTLIPAAQLTAENPLTNQGFCESPTEFKVSNDKQIGSKEIKIGDRSCLIQCHSLRYLSFACKARQSSDVVIVAMSAQFGLVVVFPTRPFGLAKLNNKNVLEEKSYFRYRMLPCEKAVPEPFPESIKILKRKFELENILISKNLHCSNTL
jgi:hypothetical protein